MSTVIYWIGQSHRLRGDSRLSVTDLIRVLSLEDHILFDIQEMIMKILNEITHRSYLPDMNFHQSDIEIYTAETCYVLTNEDTTFQSEGKKKTTILICWTFLFEISQN